MGKKTPSIIFCLILTLALYQCSRPTSPNFDNVYDVDGDAYIPFSILNASTVIPRALTAISGGFFSDNYGKPIQQKGVCWSEDEDPTTDDSCTNDGEGNSNFTSQIIGLSPSTTYYLRAYSINEDGTTYSENIEFQTQSGLPDVTSNEPFDITAVNAKILGQILKDNGSDIIERGACYELESNSDNLLDNCIDVGVGLGLGTFEVQLSQLNPLSAYVIRVFAKTEAGISLGDEFRFTTMSGLPSVITSEPTNISVHTAVIGGMASTNGIEVTSRGLCFKEGYEVPDYSDNCIYLGNGTGDFSTTVHELQRGGTYSVRAFAFTEFGDAWGQKVQFETVDWLIDEQTSIVEVINPATGRIWMDRNLGASRAALSSTDVQSFGSLYQWGRAADGHQMRNSGTTSTLSDTDQPIHGFFITNSSQLNGDWRAQRADHLWQLPEYINNPCPEGFRVPTQAEWDQERSTWFTNTAASAFASPLKLPVAAYRTANGNIVTFGRGNYWTTNIDGRSSANFTFTNNDAYFYSAFRANGFSVRCIKD